MSRFLGYTEFPTVFRMAWLREKCQEHHHALDTVGAHAVTIGDIPSLERFQVHPNGKSRLTHHTTSQIARGEIAMCTAWIRLLVVLATAVTSRATFAQTREFSSYWGTGGAATRTVVVDREGNIYMLGGRARRTGRPRLGRPMPVVANRM